MIDLTNFIIEKLKKCKVRYHENIEPNFYEYSYMAFETYYGVEKIAIVYEVKFQQELFISRGKSEIVADENSFIHKLEAYNEDGEEIKFAFEEKIINDFIIKNK